MDAKQRFSNRVAQYIQARPGYPAGVVETLRRVCGLSPASAVADLGSGTGLLARPFLAFGCQVYGVEPNPDMRSAGETLLSGYPNFISVDGTAEATGLPAASMDLMTAGQAFHWFDPAAARAECLRILKPGGSAALVWNARRIDSTPFLRAYEALLQQYGTDYNQIKHQNVEEDPHAIPAFFGGPYQLARFENVQVFDADGVAARLLSSSYVPSADDPACAAMLADLKRIFDAHQQQGVIAFEYETRMFYGPLHP